MSTTTTTPAAQRWRIPTMARACAGATRLTPAEVADTMAPARLGLEALRTGRATLDHHALLHTAVAMAEAIEHQGVVRGLQPYWDAADAALLAVWQRAHSASGWRTPTLRGPELAAITTAVDLHAWQLAQLSAGELTRAARLLVARTQSAGKPVERTTLARLRAGTNPNHHPPVTHKGAPA